MNMMMYLIALPGSPRKPSVSIAFSVALCIFSSSISAQDVDDSGSSDTVAERTLLSEQSITEQSLSFGDMLRLAMVDNPAIDIADARIDQAAQLSRQNASYRFPKVEVSGAIGPEQNEPVPSEESGKATTTGRNLKLTVTKLFYDGGASRSEFERSKRLVSAAEAEAQIVVEELFLEVVEYYMDYWRYQSELAQAAEFVATMEKLLADLDAMYQGGAASKLEVDFARARLASARGMSSAATASMNNAFSELEYLSPGLRPFISADPDLQESLDLLPLSDYLDRGAIANSGFVTNQLNMEATQLRVSAQKGRFRPTLDLELSGSIIDDEAGPSVQRDKAAAKLLFSYSLYTGGERRAGVRRAEAQLRELTAERVQLERDVFRSIDQAYNAITSSKITLDAVSEEIDANRELQRLNRQNLELGTINIIELIDVEERLFNARVRMNEIQASMYKQYFRLMIGSGFTPNVLDGYSLGLIDN